MEAILGGGRKLTTPAIERGINLEHKVLQVLKTGKKMQIPKCGLFTRPEFPIFGASPDGITSTHVIEIKCPSKDKTYMNYIKDGQVTKKYYAQIQLQMLLARRQKGYFVVASPQFKTSKEVEIVEVELNEKELFDLMDKTLMFWSNLFKMRYFTKE